MWAPRQIGAGSERMYQPIHTGDLTKWAQWGFLSQVSITFSDISRAYHLCKKEISPTVGTKAVRLYGFDGDYLTSMLASQIDLVFPFKHMVLTSDDLNQKPERTSDIGGIDPILSSYTLASAWPTSVDSQGQPAGGASAPFGSVYFSESGARRFHHLTKVPGGLRRFKIQASLSYKDNSRAVPRSFCL